MSSSLAAAAASLCCPSFFPTTHAHTGQAEREHGRCRALHPRQPGRTTGLLPRASCQPHHLPQAQRLQGLRLDRQCAAEPAVCVAALRAAVNWLRVSASFAALSLVCCLCPVPLPCSNFALFPHNQYDAYTPHTISLNRHRPSPLGPSLWASWSSTRCCPWPCWRHAHACQAVVAATTANNHAASALPTQLTCGAASPTAAPPTAPPPSPAASCPPQPCTCASALPPLSLSARCSLLQPA